MSKAFSTFYDALLPELPGCTTALLDYHLRAVAIDLCDRGSVWVEECPPYDAEDDTLTYPVVLSAAQADLVRFVRLRIADRLEWDARPYAHDAEEVPCYAPDQPPFTTDARAQFVTFTEQPTGEIVFTAAMRPKRTVTVLPDVLYDQHFETLRAGVLARLMLMGGKKWTDRDLGAAYGAEYAGRMNFAALTAARSNTRVPLRTRKTTI